MLLYAEATFGEEEQDAVLDVFTNGWLSGGKKTSEFEEKLAKWWGVKYAVAVNSGSSANFVATQALDLPKGSEVLTMALSFPTTVSPILYMGLKPVYLDCDLPSYTVKLDDSAVTKDTKALIFAHTLGNIVNMDEVMSFVKKHDLKLLEDCCDAMGGNWKGKPVGTFGDMATVSFYPAHHMTTFGEGGAILTNDYTLYNACRSIRDWGKACVCKFAEHGCKARFANPPYDHRYFYTRLGLNFKMTEASAAFGTVQLDRIDDFVRSRKINFDYLYHALKDVAIVTTPIEGADPSWFAFPIYHPNKLRATEYLEKHGVQTRSLFSGNILKHPAYKGSGRSVPVPNSDKVLDNVFFVGVGPKLTIDDLDYMIKRIKETL
jgi:CDP-4-dehydro-6-deoxyglucose reductase, E1